MAGEKIMSAIVIRKARPQDSDELAEIEKECFSAPWSRESLLHDIEENPAATIIVAQNREGTIMGYVDIWCVDDEGYINNVAVRPEFRRKHLGMLLLHTLIEVTTGKGVKSHTLEVRVSNEPAIGLYEKMGFRSAGIRPHYYEDGEDAMIMWRIGDPSPSEELS